MPNYIPKILHFREKMIFLNSFLKVAFSWDVLDAGPSSLIFTRYAEPPDVPVAMQNYTSIRNRSRKKYFISGGLQIFRKSLRNQF